MLTNNSGVSHEEVNEGTGGLHIIFTRTSLICYKYLQEWLTTSSTCFPIWHISCRAKSQQWSHRSQTWRTSAQTSAQYEWRPVCVWPRWHFFNGHYLFIYLLQSCVAVKSKVIILWREICVDSLISPHWYSCYCSAYTAHIWARLAQPHGQG